MELILNGSVTDVVKEVLQFYPKSKDVSAFEPQCNSTSILAIPPAADVSILATPSAENSTEITLPFDIPVEELESTLDESPL